MKDKVGRSSCYLLSCLRPVSCLADTDYESWEEVENEEVANEAAANGSDWLNDTRMVVEAPVMTNRHTSAGKSSRGKSRGFVFKF